MLRFAFLIATGLLLSLVAAFGEHRMISIGDRHLSMDCDGDSARSQTVILLAGGGRPAADWAKVQSGISRFIRVCSYDRANFGESDKVAEPIQSVEGVVDDLHALLKASGERKPFILVAHSIAGIYARRFVIEYPGDVVGLVFVDSSHEEQALRLHEIDPNGPPLDELTASLGFYVKPGERLEWRTDLPLIVLAHGKPFPRNARDGSNSQTNRMTEQQFAAWDRAWRNLQEDLTKRSTHGQLRIAEESGHMIPLEQPELVVKAIRDVSESASK